MMPTMPVSVSGNRVSQPTRDMTSAKHSPQAAAIDLFCGAGGLSYGMQRAGMRIVGGIDIDPHCRHPFEANVKANFHELDISKLSPQFIASLFPQGGARVLAGCAPCQPFSSYTSRSSVGRHQWQLLDKFGKIVLDSQPEIVTMENVPRLRSTRCSIDSYPSSIAPTITTVIGWFGVPTTEFHKRDCASCSWLRG